MFVYIVVVIDVDGSSVYVGIVVYFFCIVVGWFGIGFFLFVFSIVGFSGICCFVVVCFFSFGVVGFIFVVVICFSWLCLYRYGV